ncbi:NAD(P)/FAD-dependent oxidoreductase [bacterium]|nr:NAD(P)/FAD-dependent oxidoreductase [bacterium]
MSTAKKDVIIIGAGAAGLMCAIEAGKRGRSVALLEHAEKIGKKILISGGGRCNFTNLYSNPQNFLSQNGHFCKSALSRFTPADFIRLIEKHGIAYHEKKLGQLFCDKSAREVVAMLQKECRAAGVEIVLNCNVSEIQKGQEFRIQTVRDLFTSDSLVIASGGLSIPKMGATDIAYQIARQFKLTVTPTAPGLVPLVCDQKFLSVFGALSGISVDAEVLCNGVSFRENILFTHRGLSGPAILQISSYWKAGDSVEINLLPNTDLYSILKTNALSRMKLDNFLAQFFSKRFIEKFCETFFEVKPIYQYVDKDLKKIANAIHHWRVTPIGTEGYDKAEVTCGGIDTNELSSKTMESKKVPGLYYIGEAVDVTGHLGGHNFQWAWASGFAAGQYA